MNIEWNEDGTKFTHWDVQSAVWLGDWDGTKYTSTNYANIQWSID